MIDRVKLQIQAVLDGHILSNPEVFTNCQMAEAGDNFNFTFDNFRCKYIGANNTVELTGSLHKFQMGNNYGDFGHEDVCKAFTRIATAFRVPLDSIIICSLEIGVNLVMSKQASYYYNCFKTYSRNLFIWMNPLPGTSKIGGVKSCGSQKVLKLYDKTYEARRKTKKAMKSLIPDNILRIEVSLTSNYLRVNKIKFSAEDILRRRYYLRYIRELKYAFADSEKVNEISLTDLASLDSTTSKHYLFITSDNYVKYLEMLKSNAANFKYENRKRKQTLDIVSKIVPPYNYIEELNHRFFEKCNSLIG